MTLYERLVAASLCLAFPVVSCALLAAVDRLEARWHRRRF